MYTPNILNITHCANKYGISMWQRVIKDHHNSQNYILKSDFSTSPFADSSLTQQPI